MKLKSFFIIASNFDDDFLYPSNAVYQAEKEYQEPLQVQLDAINDNPDEDKGFERCLSDLQRRAMNSCQDDTISIFLVTDFANPVLVCSQRGFLESWVELF